VRHTKKKKDKSTEMDSEWAQMLNLASKDFKKLLLVHMSKELKENMVAMS
jgi:phosphoribosyl 1,2-cyclic phosphodiesterase